MKVLERDDLLEISRYLGALLALYKGSSSWFTDSEYHVAILDKLIRLIREELYV